MLLITIEEGIYGLYHRIRSKYENAQTWIFHLHIGEDAIIIADQPVGIVVKTMKQRSKITLEPKGDARVVFCFDIC